MRKAGLIVAALILSFRLPTSETPPSDVAPVSPEHATNVRILFAGDIMLGRGVSQIAAMDPEGLFADVRHVLSSSDLAVANLESPLTLRKHISPNRNALEADLSVAPLLAAAGLDAVSLANNHAGDAGPTSVVDTMEALSSETLVPLGVGMRGEEAHRFKVFAVDGLRVALLAIDATGAGLPAGSGPGVARWDPNRVRTAVAGARRVADIVAVSVHGGVEYRTTTDPFMFRVAQAMARWGVDVVWGHGPHVVQPVRVIDPDHDGRPTVVATSLGNFLFDQVIPGTREGAVLEVGLSGGGVFAYRLGETEHSDRRVHFSGWRLPARDAVALEGEWWTLARHPVPPAVERPGALPNWAGTGWTVTDASVGDPTGDGQVEVVVSFRRPFLKTPEKRALRGLPWSDTLGRSAHLGLYRSDDLRPIWVAGTLVRPVNAVAPCDGAMAVAYSTLDDPTTVSTGAWLWRGFGFVSAPELPGPGRPACADMDADGRSDPVIVERSSP